MGSSDERERIMNQHEEEVMRIKNLQRKDEQEAGIKRFIIEHNIKIGKKEIERIREKDLQEYEIKGKELRIKEK